MAKALFGRNLVVHRQVLSRGRKEHSTSACRGGGRGKAYERGIPPMTREKGARVSALNSSKAFLSHNHALEDRKEDRKHHLSSPRHPGVEDNRSQVGRLARRHTQPRRCQSKYEV